MPLLDLDELDGIARRSRLWAIERPAWVSWRRRDYLGDPAVPLARAVRDEAERLLGIRPQGKVLQLAQPRHLGHAFNPIALYFCFDRQGALRACVAEVTSTPWGERIRYAMAVPEGVDRWTHSHPKAMHVSPFLAMDMDYHWRLRWRDERLSVHIANMRGGERLFDATLCLDLAPATTGNLRRAALRFPLMSTRIIAAIHWQALRLWLKGVPFIPRSRALETS